MSRTYRNPRYSGYYRHIHVEGTRRVECAAVCALKDAGYQVPPRLRARASGADERHLPNAYVNRQVAAWREIPIAVSPHGRHAIQWLRRNCGLVAHGDY